MKFIDNIRQKTEAEKKRFAFNISLLITGIIFAIWFIATVSTFNSFDISGTIESTKSVVSPIKSVIASFKSVFN